MVNVKAKSETSHQSKKPIHRPPIIWAICHYQIWRSSIGNFATFFSNPFLIIILPAPNCKIRFASISLSFPEFDIFFRSNLQISAGDSLEKFHIFQNCSILLFRHFKFIFFICFWKPTQKNWKKSICIIKNGSGSSLLRDFFYKFYLNKS